MLAGIVLSGITAGACSLALSVLSGHPPLVSLALYSLAGCCGVLGFSLLAVKASDQSL